jgi:hypothetical protein
MAHCESTTSGLTNLTSSTKRKKRPIKKTAQLDANETDEDIANYCIRNGDAKDVRMVACDSEDCPHKPFEWFHFTCMKLKHEPVGSNEDYLSLMRAYSDYP